VIPLPSELAARLAAGGREVTLVVVRLAALGDILRTLPAVRLLRGGAPQVRIVWVADDRWADVLEGHSDLAQVVRFPRRATDRLRASPAGWPRLSGPLRRFVSELRDATRATPHAAVIDFHGNLRSGLIGAASGARVRLGFEGHQQKEGNRLLTTHRVPVGERRESRIDRNLRLVRALGFPTAPLPAGGLPIRQADEARAAGIVRDSFGEGSSCAVISPGASARQAYKKPPSGLLAAAARTLADRGTGSLVVWGPGEEDDARRVVDLAPGACRLAPPTDLPTLTALLRHARLFVGGDTGPLHLACAVSCPVVAIYGPTDPVVNAPWGVPHAAVFPPERAYVGIPRVDRVAGGFEGIDERQVAEAVDLVVNAPRQAR